VLNPASRPTRITRLQLLDLLLGQPFNPFYKQLQASTAEYQYPKQAVACSTDHSSSRGDHTQHQGRRHVPAAVLPQIILIELKESGQQTVTVFDINQFYQDVPELATVMGVVVKVHSRASELHPLRCNWPKRPEWSLICC